jgi:hypothetical protein
MVKKAESLPEIAAYEIQDRDDSRSRGRNFGHRAIQSACCVHTWQGGEAD